MQHDHPFLRAIACLTGGLLVAWIGGTIGAAGFKAVYWLAVGSWPETGLHALVPDQAIRAMLRMPDGEMLGSVLLYLLHVDILTCVMLVPPVLLLPCLLILLANRRAVPGFTRAQRPFAASRSSNHGLPRLDAATESTIRGPGGILGQRPGMPIPGDTTWTRRRG